MANNKIEVLTCGQFGQKKMDIIYGRMTTKEIRLLLHSIILALPSSFQPSLIEEMALATDAEIKDFTIKAIEDMGE